MNTSLYSAIMTGSPPSRAAWIEMISSAAPAMMSPGPPSRAAWIEISHYRREMKKKESPPSRAAWIEMGSASTASTISSVAAFTGGVD